MASLQAYLPEDRRAALARGESLPERTNGSALFADISGFIPLTERLTQQLGARRGTEELSRRMNAVYDVLIQAVERHLGSVISFAGDAITCWFQAAEDGEPAPSPPKGPTTDTAPLRAITCALVMQAAMAAYPDLSLKVAVTSGAARRFVVGDPEIQLLDTLAGALIARLPIAEQLTHGAEAIADDATVEACQDMLQIAEWRAQTETGQRFAVIAAAPATMETRQPSPALDNIPVETLRPWVLPTVYAREQSGLGHFLTELRPAIALFMRFGGIEYDGDDFAQAKLDALMRRVQQVATQQGGTVLQLTIGDKGSYLYACFGAPVAHEDDARRAARTALSLRELPRELPFLDPVGIGISRGTLRTGAYGGSTRGTYGVLGDDVNLAARLMTTATPREILLSGRVQQVLGEPFTVEPRPPVRLKGKAEPVPVFVLMGATHRRATRLLEPAYRLPMMGRAVELALITSKLELARQGRGQVIGITAEASMGKSRLVAEAIRLAHRQGFAGYGGACESSGTNTPYLCWKAIWQAFFDVDTTAPPRRQLRHLEGELEDRAPDRLQSLPLLAPLIDIPIEDNDFTRSLEPKDRRNALKALLEDCVRAAVQEEPILFVLEDVHWIDPLSHDLLEALARATAALPVCFVLAYRPLDSTRSPAPRVERLPHFTRIELHELSATDAEQLIRAKLAQLFPERGRALPQELVAEITARAQGNPFFIEELLNYLRDRDISPYDEQALSTLDLPSSLHTLILSRMDQLTEAQKVTLTVASIIGRLFPFAWLHGYYPVLGAREAVKADLNELARLDITPVDTPEPELAYLFKHIVTQEVAYESVAYATRAQLHQQLAEYLEAQDSKRIDLLAFHYGRSENLSKQREYFRKAGDAAQAAYANTAAVDYYEQLLMIVPARAQERIDVLLQLGRVLHLAGHWTAAESRFREALAQPERTDQSLQARCAVALGRLLLDREDFKGALTVLERARAGVANSGDQLALKKVLSTTAVVHFERGRYESIDLGHARALAEESVSLARSVNGAGKFVGDALEALSGIAWLQKDSALERSAAEESLAARREAGDRPGIAKALYVLGLVRQQNAGGREASRPLFEESLSLSRQIGDWSRAHWPLLNLGYLSLLDGDYGVARAYFKELLDFLSEQGSRGARIGNVMMLLVVIDYMEGEFATARERLEQAQAILEPVGDKGLVVSVFPFLALTLLEEGDTARASDLLRETLTLVQRWNETYLKRLCLVVAARLRQTRGAWVRAARLCAAFDAHSPQPDGSLSRSDDVPRRVHARIVADLKLQLGPVQFAAAWAEGKNMTLDEALAFAQETG